MATIYIEAMALASSPAQTVQCGDAHSDMGVQEPSAMRDPLAYSDPLAHSDLLAHINAIEQDGLSMMDLIDAMKADATNQDELIAVIAKRLDDTVKRSDERGRVTQMAAFEGELLPISPATYVRRIIRYGGASPCCLVIGLIYLERLQRRVDSASLTMHNMQRLFLVSVMTAAKFLDDRYNSNKVWAQVGGIPTAELNQLEMLFLFRLSFSLYISREEYDAYISSLPGSEVALSAHVVVTGATMSLLAAISPPPSDAPLLRSNTPARAWLHAPLTKLGQALQKDESFTDVSAAVLAFS
jgi:hypothetical protein